MIDLLAFDADDTLWHTEGMFQMTQAQFRAMLADYGDPETIDRTLYATEMRNLRDFGYGIKGFTLAMIETALELTGKRIPGSVIEQIIEFAREMRRYPVELLDGVAETVERLAQSYPLLVVTKGELIDQESKWARSGIAHRFTHFEVVSDKTPEVYRSLLARHRVEAGNFLMVGNSLRSDILPVLAIGGQAAHIPYHTTWVHEQVPDEQHSGGYHTLEHIRQLPALVERLRAQ